MVQRPIQDSTEQNVSEDGQAVCVLAVLAGPGEHVDQNHFQSLADMAAAQGVRAFVLIADSAEQLQLPASTIDVTALAANDARASFMRAVEEIAAADPGDTPEPALLLPTLEAAMSAQNGPAPDLVLVSAGQRSLRNGLCWTAAYSEFVFLDECVADITPQKLSECLTDYQQRERRFGGLKPDAAT